jgi:hypothetical protein
MEGLGNTLHHFAYACISSDEAARQRCNKGEQAPYDRLPCQARPQRRYRRCDRVVEDSYLGVRRIGCNYFLCRGFERCSMRNRPHLRARIGIALNRVMVMDLWLVPPPSRSPGDDLRTEYYTDCRWPVARLHGPNHQLGLTKKHRNPERGACNSEQPLYEPGHVVLPNVLYPRILRCKQAHCRISRSRRQCASPGQHWLFWAKTVVSSSIIECSNTRRPARVSAASTHTPAKNARISAASACGCSSAAKWPPRGITVQRWMLNWRSAASRGGRRISCGNSQ